MAHGMTNDSSPGTQGAARGKKRVAAFGKIGRGKASGDLGEQKNLQSLHNRVKQLC